MNRQKQMIFLSISMQVFIRMFAFLVDLLCIGAITRLTLGIAKNLGWLNFQILI